MARSRLSYAEAVRLLVGGEDPVEIIGRVAGGAMLLLAPFSETVLSWFDAKGEANNILRDLLGRAPARIRAAKGRSHFELIEAAHTVLVISSFFDALGEHIGDRFKTLELTDDERARIGAGELRPLGGAGAISMPDALTGFTENLPAVERALQAMHGAFREFAAGLAAAQGMTMPAADGVVEVALQRYRDRYVRLAEDVPEFGIWSQLDEHAATRAEVRRQTETLTGVARQLGRLIDAAASEAAEGLARHYKTALSRPLWRSDSPAPDGLTFPEVEQGFVSPRFRLAVCEKNSPLSSETWWENHDVRDDLEEFLTAYLAAPDSTQRPLIILGHPGAGKSLLTEVLAARVPAEAYTTIRVPLRNVDPDAPIHEQIVAAVELVTKDRLSWGGFCRASDTTKVVLLDGFDELVQATGITQSRYVEQAATFQQEEWEQGRPVVVVITSRTLVMDRTVVREGTLVMKLEPFDEPRVQRWTEAWNTANGSQPEFRPLTVAELWRHQDLAGQPLLLLMLAVYAAEAGLDADDLSTDQLYRRLLDSFIRRQVREKAAADLGDARFAEEEIASRRDLAAVAFAMFNRRLQWVGEEDLGRDLEALHPGEERSAPAMGEPVSRARRTVAAFFFVHVARTDDETRTPGRRSYEFLHATFGEYLVAEHTVELLTGLAEDWQRARRRAYQPTLDERVLRTLLSHQPLSNGEQILPFLMDMIAARPETERETLLEVILELFRMARKRITDDAYRPTPFDLVNRTAAYTANLTLLAVLCRPKVGVTVDELCGNGAPDFESVVRLWRSGLTEEAQEGLFAWLRREESRLVVSVHDPWSEPTSAFHEARLVGDFVGEAALRTGWVTFESGEDTMDAPARTTAFGRDFHVRVVELFVWGWPAAGLARLLPYDEAAYVSLADLLDKSDRSGIFHGSLNVLMQCLLRDGPHLGAETLDRLVVRFRDEWRGGVNVPILLLALSHPALLRRQPWLCDAVVETDIPGYLHEVAQFCRERDPDQLDPIIKKLGERAVVHSGDFFPSEDSGAVR
ncbi:NACHT domain-containing protein [Actinoplanes sp. HUAS TT8]|uniref:NACHT domain-containing protein n=1 Tax=Actinoplanes sp. HUAS TT8 TaxID=3447453 RepID=UPI003F527861